MDLTEIKLKESKSFVKLFGLDYDGTVCDGIDYKLPEVLSLAEKILNKGKFLAFVTARAATALKTLAPPLRELLVRKGVSIPCFIAGANGAVLREVKKDGLSEIYNHGLEMPEILRAVDAGRKIYEKLKIRRADLAEKGLETFRKFLREDWDDYVPLEIIGVCRPYDGEIFTEQAKVTFVLPKDKSSHLKIVAEINAKLGDEYCAAAGDETYVHITKKFDEDGKTAAIKTILKLLNLEENEVATFGDMPAGNDAGLLSFPYGFTNSAEFAKIKNNLEQPPYILTEPGLTPVARVYNAIDYLLS